MVQGAPAAYPTLPAGQQQTTTGNNGGEKLVLGGVGGGWKSWSEGEKAGVIASGVLLGVWVLVVGWWVGRVRGRRGREEREVETGVREEKEEEKRKRVWGWLLGWRGRGGKRETAEEEEGSTVITGVDSQGRPGGASDDGRYMMTGAALSSDGGRSRSRSQVRAAERPFLPPNQQRVSQSRGRRVGGRDGESALGAARGEEESGRNSSRREGRGEGRSVRDAVSKRGLVLPSPALSSFFPSSLPNPVLPFRRILITDISQPKLEPALRLLLFAAQPPPRGCAPVGSRQLTKSKRRKRKMKTTHCAC